MVKVRIFRFLPWCYEYNKATPRYDFKKIAMFLKLK